MSERGTCLQSYIPVRAEARPGAEMLTSLIFGESYTILENQNDFLKIHSDFDGYEGWISANTHSEYTAFDTLNTHIFLEAHGEHQILFIPCGALIPSTGRLLIEGRPFVVERKLKTYHHLPMPLRLQKLALSFMNMPYLWGGRTFMGIDCSGLIQVVFKANGIDLPRDTSLQQHCGVEVSFQEARPCDLVFFSKPGSDRISHVGMMLDKKQVIHASGKVRTDLLRADGMQISPQSAYQLRSIRRIL